MQAWGELKFDSPRSLRPELTQHSAQLMRYIVDPVNFTVNSGSTSYLFRTTALTCAVTTTQSIFSLWFNLSSNSDGEQVRFFQNSSGGLNCNKSSLNAMRIYAYSTDFILSMFDVTSSATYTSTSGWHHVMWSWASTNTSGTFSWYIDNVAIPYSTGSIRNSSGPAYGSTIFFIGANSTIPVQVFYGDMADVYMNFAEYRDLTQSSNRLLFRTAQGQPADIGPQGQTPTGNIPIVMLKGPAAAWGTNSGYGGNFTVQGSFTNSTSIPGG